MISAFTGTSAITTIRQSAGCVGLSLTCFQRTAETWLESCAACRGPRTRSSVHCPGAFPINLHAERPLDDSCVTEKLQVAGFRRVHKGLFTILAHIRSHK